MTVESRTLSVTHVVVDCRFIEEAIQGARRSWGSNDNYDSIVYPSTSGGILVLGQNDYKLITQRLLTGAVGEDKFLRTIPVSMRVTADKIFWRQMDQYRVGVTTQSDSVMHTRRGKRVLFSQEEFHIDTPIESVVITNTLYQAWRSSGEPANATSMLWRQWQRSIPDGFLYTRHFFANYKVLRHIIIQRAHHRNDDWHTFCNLLFHCIPLADPLLTFTKQ